MLEKIKETLGEELAKQVEEKLGSIELGIVNDGSLVPATKYDTLKTEHKALTSKYEDEMKALNEKFKEVSTTAEDAEKTKELLAEMKKNHEKTIADYDNNLKEIKIKSALDVALLKENAKNAKAVQALLDMETLKLSEDGNLLGLSEQLEKIKETDSYLFGEVKMQGKSPDKGLDTAIGEKQILIDKYNEAEKAGNASEMFALQAQIKNIT